MGRTPRVVGSVLFGVVLSFALALPASATLPLRRKECGDVVTRSFRLKNDLRGCPEHGLVVGASGITIDLNGKLVSGDQVRIGTVVAGTAEAGIQIGALSDVVVKNGRIRRFTWGVGVSGPSRRVTLKQLKVSRNTRVGIMIDGGRRHTVIDNEVWDNGDPAVDTGTGIEVNATLSKILDNQVDPNVKVGIFLEGGDIRVEFNRVFGNETGIVFYGDDYTLYRNRPRLNVDYGILGTGNNNEVTRNVLCGNGADPQLEVLGTGNTVADNSIRKDCPE